VLEVRSDVGSHVDLPDGVGSGLRYSRVSSPVSGYNVEDIVIKLDYSKTA